MSELEAIYWDHRQRTAHCECRNCGAYRLNASDLNIQKELTRLRAIEQAAREAVRALDAEPFDANESAIAHEALSAALGIKS